LSAIEQGEFINTTISTWCFSHYIHEST